MRIWINILLCLLTANSAKAQEPGDGILCSGEQRSVMLSVGCINLLDTYLSPEKYQGTEVGFMANRTMVLKKDWRWDRSFSHHGALAMAKNKVGNANFLAGSYNDPFAMRRRWTFLDEKLLVEGGGGIEANLGVLYSTRNGNNPVQLKTSLNVATSGVATYFFKIKDAVWNVRYEVAFPLVGAMFSPHYGQSYYEIFSRGNYDHNIVFTSPFNTPSVRQMLTIDIPLAKSCLRIGYLGNFQQAKANNLKYHSYSHAFVVGIAPKLFTSTSNP